MIKPKKSLEKLIAYEVPLFEKEWSIKIDSNENLYGPSPNVLNAIRNVNAKDIQYYPAYGELSQKIADVTGFDIENIKITNGADEAIYSIFQAYLDEGDVVLTVTPSFAMPVIYSKILGAELIEVPYTKKWEFPIDEFCQKLKISDAKIVHLTTPNNPTGDIINFDNILKILELSKDKVVLIDETYGKYCGKTYKDLVKDYDNVFIVRSMSKDFGLAGLRLGYIISNENNIKILKSVISPYSVNSIALRAGIAALEDKEHFIRVRQYIEHSKNILTSAFEGIGGVVYPSFANFICVEFPKYGDFVYKILKDHNIIIKKFKNNEMLKNTYRITAPRVEEALKIVEFLKPRDTLVFDMDGVLINAVNSYRLTIKKTFEHFTGEELPEYEIQEAKNLGGLNNDWDLTEHLLKKRGINVPKSEIVEKFQSIYWDNGHGLINNENLLLDKSSLKLLLKDYNLAIFTGRPRQEALYSLELHGIKDLFYPVVTMNDLSPENQKPSGAGLELIKDSIFSNKVYYFGDTVDDMISGKSADVITVGVLPPQDKSTEALYNLESKGANMVLDSINDIFNILEKVYEM